MRKLIEFSVANRVIVNLVLLLVAVLGTVTYFEIHRELFPEFSRRAVRIDTVYLGASPEEVEELITAKIEEEVFQVDGVSELLSVSREGQSEVLIRFQPTTDMSRALSDVRAALDRVTNLPQEAEEPSVSEVKSAFPVITVSLGGDIAESELKNIAKDIRDELKRIEDVAMVRILGTREKQIFVEVDPERLDKYGLSLEELSGAINRQNRNVPGGTLKTRRGEILLRTLGEADGVRDVERIILRSTDTGHILTVGEVADVYESFEDATIIGRFGGRPSINLVVIKERTGDAINIARRVREEVERIEQGLPETIVIGVFNDFSVFIRNRLETLAQSGLIGLIIVLTTLCIFVRGRVALLTAVGIPFSLLGCLVLMEFAGLSLNMVSVFGLILVLGLLVDDAVIVTENVYRHVEAGMDTRRAAVEGACEVAWPVVTTVLTTVAAFMPFLLLPGTMGIFLEPIPLVVSFALLASLLEVLFVLPSHLADVITPAYARRVQHRELAWLARFRSGYETVLAASVRWRYVAVTAIVAVSVLLAAAGIYRLPFVLFREFESSQFFVNFETSAGAKIEDTEAIARQAEAFILALPPGELESLATTVGIAFQDETRVLRGPNVGQLTVELKETRTRNADEVIEELRAEMERIPGIEKIQFLKVQAGPGGPDIEARVTGNELDTLRELANEVKAYLGSIAGVRDIRDDFIEGKEEIRISLRPEGHALGLDLREISRQVQQAFQGVEASSIQRRDEEIPIVVRFPAERRRDVETVSRMKLTLSSGERVFLSEVAEIDTGIGASQINRDDQKRALSIFGDVNPAQTTVVEVTNKLRERFDNIGARYPGYRVVVKGERQELEESLTALPQISLVALFVIYFVLGSLFKSFVQPFIVMVAIPFGADGVVLGHLIMGEPLSFLSIMGLVALAGVVVNDSLIVVDFINRARANGMPLNDAIVQSGVTRLRPVLLTTITTVGGLVPLAFFSTGQARFLSPMAISVVWGLSFATVLTLILTPCLYGIVEDVKSVLRRLARTERFDSGRTGAYIGFRRVGRAKPDQP